MAKIYATPISAPKFEEYMVDGRYVPERARAVDKRYFGALREWLREKGWTEAEAGKVVRFPVADGYACYMIVSLKAGVKLLHLPLGDAYAIPEAHARGLRAEDVRRLLQREAAINKLFPGNREIE